jgi:DNA-binding MarR family transcriptional regulator
VADPGIREFRKHLRAIERAVGSLLKGETVCCGVTPAQCHVLLEIAEAGETSLVDLAQRLGLDSSTLSRTVDGLVKAGLVIRETDPGNRRYVKLRLTVAGRSKVGLIDGACDRFYADLLGRVPKHERPRLAESVKLLARMLAGSGGAPCGPEGGITTATGRKGRIQREKRK